MARTTARTTSWRPLFFTALGAAATALLPWLPAGCSGSDDGGIDATSDRSSDAKNDPTTRPDADATVDAPFEDAPDDVKPDATPFVCAPPEGDAAALCIEWEPDDVDFVAAEARLDGKGVLRLAVFDAGRPQLPDGGTIEPLAPELRWPELDQDGGALGALTDLRSLPRGRVVVPPGTVYALTTFYESTSEAHQYGPFEIGPDPAPRWVAGRDFDGGLNGPLTPITLAAGEARTVRLSLRALRQLVVTASLADAAAPGDGVGTLTFLAFRTDEPRSGLTFVGQGQRLCAPVGAGAETVRGIALGSTSLEVVGLFDDRGSRITDFVPGAITNVDEDGAVPVQHRVTIDGKAYVKSLAIELTRALPDLADAAPQPDACP